MLLSGGGLSVLVGAVATTGATAVPTAAATTATSVVGVLVGRDCGSSCRASGSWLAQGRTADALGEEVELEDSSWGISAYFFFFFTRHVQPKSIG